MGSPVKGILDSEGVPTCAYLKMFPFKWDPQWRGSLEDFGFLLLPKGSVFPFKWDPQWRGSQKSLPLKRGDILEVSIQVGSPVKGIKGLCCGRYYWYWCYEFPFKWDPQWRGSPGEVLVPVKNRTIKVSIQVGSPVKGIVRDGSILSSSELAEFPFKWDPQWRGSHKEKVRTLTT